MKIKAIETEYKGYKFRSRLEARWAVFFDAMGIEYQYEPEGFEREVYGCVYRWLPDFYLPELKVWVEVKGGKLSDADAEKMSWILDDYDCPMDGFTFSAERKISYVRGGLLLLGDIPEPTGDLVLHTLIRHREGLIGEYVRFKSMVGGYLEIFDSYEAEAHDLPKHEWFCGGDVADDNFKFKHESIKSPSFYPLVRDAYKKARQARFEHGECP